jgi:hypothetical protein
MGCTAAENETLDVPQVHIPATHAWPMAHALPHIPQWFGSVFVSAHTDPQEMAPPGQTH